MGDNKKKWLWISLGIVAGILVLGYIGTALYFMSHFLPNTKVNGKDFSYAKEEDVADYLKSEVKKYELKITEHAGLSDMITGKEISVEYKENGVIDKLLKEQSVFLWPAAWSGEGKGLSITASADYDEKALDAKIASLTAMTTEQVQPISSMPVFNGEKFVPGDITEGTAIDADALKKAVVQAIEGLQEQLNLDEAGCYVQPLYTKESPEVQQACDAMNAYLNASVTYEMGLDTPVVVDKTIISQWVTVDENYVVTFHPELIQEWVTQFAQQYDTAGKTRQFTTPDGRAAEVSGGTYGWEINEKAEYETLLANVESGETISREPVYVEGKTAASHGAQDWGSTYAEVDLTNQKMWYVKDGEVLMSADVVTGLPKGGRSTPAGVYTILERMQNKVLRGNLRPDGTREYETPVKYWMRVTYSGVGFHDATWQSSFGGNVYTYRGSHGCINMSYSDAGKLYELIQVGDPVIMHY